MTDLNFTNAAVSAGFTCRNDRLGKFEFFNGVKHIYYRDGLWICDNNETSETNKYTGLKEAIEAEADD